MRKTFLQGHWSDDAPPLQRILGHNGSVMLKMIQKIQEVIV